MKKNLLQHFLLLSLFSCSIAQQESSQWNLEQNLSDGWEITNPSSVGINVDSIFSLFDLIRKFG